MKTRGVTAVLVIAMAVCVACDLSSASKLMEPRLGRALLQGTDAASPAPTASDAAAAPGATTNAASPGGSDASPSGSPVSPSGSGAISPASDSDLRCNRRDPANGCGSTGLSVYCCETAIGTAGGNCGSLSDSGLAQCPDNYPYPQCCRVS